MTKHSFLYLTIYLFTFLSCKNEAKYSYIGEFNYTIINDSDFKNTYLYDSFGYLIGDLDIPGLKLKGVKKLKNDVDYLISYQYPVKKVLTKSKNISGEGLELSKKPVEVILDKTQKFNKVFIYSIGKRGVYRLLQP